MMTDDEIIEFLGISIAELEEMRACDKAIDQGKSMPFDLTKEQEKQAKKVLRGKKENKPPRKNNQKKDSFKEGIFQEIHDFLSSNVSFSLENVEISPKKNEITFIFQEESYTLKIIRHRKEKK